MDTRAGASGNQLLNLAQVTSALANQSNALTTENQQLKGLVNYLTNAVTTLTAGTLENTQRIQELKRELPEKKKRRRGGRQKALKRLAGVSRAATNGFLSGPLSIEVAQEVQALANNLGAQIKQDYVKQKQEQIRSKPNVESIVRVSCPTIHDLNKRLSVEFRKGKSHSDSYKRRHDLKEQAKVARRRTINWVAQLPTQYPEDGSPYFGHSKPKE